MSEDPEAIAREIESYLLVHAPKQDAISLQPREIVEFAENDREIVSVSRLAHALRLSAVPSRILANVRSAFRRNG